jgi:cellulose synthase operon protein YhjQ
VVAVDLDQQNGLHVHFGLEPGSVPAICDADSERAPTNRGRRRDRGDQPCVAYSWSSNPSQDELVPGHPEWLARRIEAVAPPGCEIVLLDTPARRAPILLHALELADVVIAVMTPEPAAYATLLATEEMFREIRGNRQGAPAAYWLINRFDGASPLSRDIVGALRAALKDRVLPIVVHEDVAVREALARQHTLIAEPGDSQVLADLGRLAEWLQDRATFATAPRSGAPKPLRR